jgi:hypothetical protein
VLRSSKTIRKEPMQMAPCFGWSSPDPWFGPVVQLCCRHLHRPFNLIRVGKTLTSQRIAAKEAPPSLLEVEPARSFGNEDVVNEWVLRQPGAGLQAVVTTEIVRNDEDVPLGIVGLDGLEQFNIVLGIARCGAARDLLAIADPQGPIDPHLLLAATVLQRRFDAVAIGGPARRGRKRAWNQGAEFVGADGRRSLRRFDVVGDDRGPFGTKSLSSLFPQL